MTRLPPVKHNVRSYTRSDGKLVDTYKRGSRDKPKNVPVKRGSSRRSGKLYSIKFGFSDGGSETYPGSGTLSGAIKQATAKIQRPKLPVRVDWEMIV